MQKIEILRTKSGLPVVAERGGGMTRTGHATIVCDENGAPPRAIHIFRSGHLACGTHALVACRPGLRIVTAWRGGDVTVRRITASPSRLPPATGPDEVDVVVVWERSTGDSAEPMPTYLEEAIATAERKARTYHCRDAMYVTEPPRKTPTSRY